MLTQAGYIFETLYDRLTILNDRINRREASYDEHDEYIETLEYIIENFGDFYNERLAEYDENKQIMNEINK